MVGINFKQVLNVLYQVFVFRVDRKTKMAAIATVSTFLQSLNGIRRSLPGSKNSIVLNQVFTFVRVDWKTTTDSLASVWLRLFQLLLCRRWAELYETLQEEIKYTASFTKFALFGSFNKQRLHMVLSLRYKAVLGLSLWRILTNPNTTRHIRSLRLLMEAGYGHCRVIALSRYRLVHNAITRQRDNATTR